MFNLLKNKFIKSNKPEPSTQDTPEKIGFFGRLKAGLSKTRAKFTSGLANLIIGKKQIDAALLEEIETALLTADVGIDATQHLISCLTQKLARKELKDADAVLTTLRTEMTAILKPCEQSIDLSDIKSSPYVILAIGINGAGKTTTIGKLAHYYQTNFNKKIMLAAGDTFRAAAIEQLQTWGERNNIPVISQQPGADTAAVIHDAMTSAKAKNIDLLIADTAGRLHTQNHLMEELKKVKRVLQRLDADAPQETLLIIDAGNGQNALTQAKQFHQALGVTGIVLTKLDGTAKGGIIFAIARELNLPVRFIGVGEQIDDLRQFNADEFVAALFETEEASAG